MAPTPPSHLHESLSSPYVLPVPPRRLCVGAGALSPEKGGALRKQSTRGRRLGVATVLCGGVFGAPLLLLPHGSAHAVRLTSASPHVGAQAARGRTMYSAALPSQLVRYQSTTTTTTPTTVPPPPAPTTTTTTVPPATPVDQVSARATPVAAVMPATSSVAPVVATDGEHGQATWYAAAPAGMCASPTLPFGTVLTVTNVADGASTTCTVDDREGAGYPRVVDMSPSGFAQLADPSQGVVDVTISW
jgi:rare lipoprotein A (peptidoglycan hydrolase)